MKESKRFINNLIKRWKIRILIETLWVAVILLLLFFTVIRFYAVSEYLLLPGFLFISIVLWLLYKNNLPQQKDIVELIDHQFEEAEYSSELLYRSPQNRLEKFQLKNLKERINHNLPLSKYPVSQQKALKIISVSVLVCLTAIILGMLRYNDPQTDPEKIYTSNISQPVITESDTLILKSFSVTIFPPAYTKTSPYSVNDPNLSIPAGSKIKIAPVFNEKPDNSWLDISNGDSVVFDNNAAWYQPTKNGFYSIYFSRNEITGYSPLYSIKIIQDKSPEINIDGLDSYQSLDYTEAGNFSFDVTISDDYGIQEVYMIATITKGSGESIKFREQRIPVKFNKGKQEFSISPEVPVESFDMEPGNELYFYVAAQDNKQPAPQTSRSESYFYIIRDTADVEFSLQGNLGVDLMPQYFKSQLQIIIDSKKLIEERSEISKKEFNTRSNDLAHDQKDIRLKYGQFIGEESESGLEIERETPPDGANVESDGQNVLSEFGHDHDHENEEGQIMDKGTRQHEDHEHEETDESENPLSEFVHSHEDRETATFYSQSLKSKLRAALSEMWDAELHLRLYDPKTSLPYQYKAYKLIREIRNHARVYVRRIGFDPPAINESEARLKKEPDDLYDKPFTESSKDSKEFDAATNLVRVLSEAKWNPGMTNSINNELDKTSQELAAASVSSHPGDFLEELMILRRIKEKKVFDKLDIQNLKVLKNRLLKLTIETSTTASNEKIERLQLMKDFKKNLAQ